MRNPALITGADNRWVLARGSVTNKLRIFLDPGGNAEHRMVDANAYLACKEDAEAGDPDAIAALLMIEMDGVR